MKSLNILLSSAGRRPYLIRWFHDALVRLGVQGRVVAADADALTASRHNADAFLTAPPVLSPRYESWLKNALQSHSIDLAMSVNDFELSRWSTLALKTEQSSGLVRLGPVAQTMAEDKLVLGRRLHAAGVQTPPTWSGTDVLRDPSLASISDRFVVKHRYGSGSAGLAFVDRSALAEAIHNLKDDARDRRGSRLDEERLAIDALVVQPMISGPEYGVDVVSDLRGRYRATLARKKLAVRNGETDKAISVNSSRFELLGRAVAGVFRHRGPIDTDVIDDEDGRLWLIDVNPRFGGGYPFSHLAGADIPAALIAWKLGLPEDPRWFAPVESITSAKSVETVRLGAL